MTAIALTPAKPYRGLGMEGFVAKWYANLTRNSIGEFRKLALQVAPQLPPGADVLEVAAGPGYFAIELARRGDFRITGLDISETFVQLSRRNAAEAQVQVDFRRGNASGMPFQRESFDFVLCRAAFKNFSQPLAALREMHRVLKPGGRALIIDLRKDASPESIRAAVDEMNLGRTNAALTRFTFRYMLLKRAYTRQDFEQMAAETRFHRTDIQKSGIGLEVLLTKSPVCVPSHSSAAM